MDMINAEEKKLLENKIYQIIRESIFEKKSAYFKPYDRRKVAKASSNRERNIIKWLTDNKSNNAAIASQLWPGKDPDTARSEFSKKVRGKDADGKPYHFSEEEINELYRIKNNFVKRIVTKMVRESIEKYLKK